MRSVMIAALSALAAAAMISVCLCSKRSKSFKAAFPFDARRLIRHQR